MLDSDPDSMRSVGRMFGKVLDVSQGVLVTSSNGGKGLRSAVRKALPELIRALKVLQR